MRITISVVPRSSRSEIIKEKEGYIAFLRSPPEEGKANIELVKLAQRYFKRPVRLRGGFHSKKKIIEII